MRARIIGAIFAGLGMLVILTPIYIFPVCGVGRYSPAPGMASARHGCSDTLRAEIIAGAAAMALGLVPLIFPSRKRLSYSSIGVSVTAIFVVLFPMYITGVCKSPTMPCVLGTRPALVILGAVLGMAGIAGVIASGKSVE